MSITINKLYIQDNFIVAANVSKTETFNDEVITINSTLRISIPIEFNDVDSLDVEQVITHLEGTDELNHLMMFNTSAVKRIQIDGTTEVVL